MKKDYLTPVAEVVKFEYKDQVVATSGCAVRHTGQKQTEELGCTCDDWGPWQAD